jgi:putative FmdB family regulatory protein
VPLYEYKCLECGRLMERIEKVAGPHLKRCSHCGGQVERLLGTPALQFKGAGWYVTDYARKTSGGDSGKTEKPASETTEAAGKEKAGGAKETSSGETQEKKQSKKK